MRKVGEAAITIFRARANGRNRDIDFRVDYDVGVNASRGFCVVVIAIAISIVACDRAASDRAVVVPIASASSSAITIASSEPRDPPKVKEECASHDVGDALFARLLPRGALGFCVDGASTKTYGELASHTLDETCTTLLDGECEVYRRNHVRRMLSTRYVTADGVNVVYAIATQFLNAAGANELFRVRTRSIASQIAPGVALEGTMAIVVYDAYLVELTFASEAPIAKGDAERVASQVEAALATDIAKRLRAGP